MAYSYRYLVWFSCGAASAVAAKLAVDKYGDACELIYCDTSVNEHPDNLRFLADVERWIGRSVTRLRNENYEDIYDVFNKTGYMVGPSGAKCTTELKKKIRLEHSRDNEYASSCCRCDLVWADDRYWCVNCDEPAQMAVIGGDVNIFGFTLDESVKIGQGGLTRTQHFESNNPEVLVEWILVDRGISKSDCYRIIQENNIELPAMYKLGYRNNNCIGCVKGGQGYWNKIRVDFPDVFDRMAKHELSMGVTCNKRYVKGEREKLFLVDLDPGAGRYDSEPDISCGITCVGLG